MQRSAVHNAKQSNCRSRSIDTAIKDLDNAKQKQERGNYKAALRLAQEARDTAKRVTDKHETAKRYVEQGYNHLRQAQLETATEKAREATPHPSTVSKCQTAFGRDKTEILRPRRKLY